MLSEVPVPQAALTDRDSCDSMSMDDDIAITVRNVGDRPQDRLKQAFLWGRKSGRLPKSKTSEVWNLRKHALEHLIRR